MISETNSCSIPPPKLGRKLSPRRDWQKTARKRRFNRIVYWHKRCLLRGRVARNIVNLEKVDVELKLKGNAPTLHLLRWSSNASLLFLVGALVRSYESENTEQLCVKPLPILRFTTVRINASKLRYPATVRNNREESESRRTVRETILLSSRITIGSTTFPNYSPRNTFETTRSREQTERGIAMGQLDFTDFGGKFHFSPTLKSSI